MTDSNPGWEHRTSYAELPTGRDRYIVAAIGPWLQQAVRRFVGERLRGCRVLDVGCGEQPLRALVEHLGATYSGFDVAQNARGSVTVVGRIDEPLPTPWPDVTATYDLILCTEVLEHVEHWEVAFGNLRSLVAEPGVIVVTVPFVFPLHMEPVDYFRATPYAIERLAARHGLTIVELVRLGGARDVLATIIDDASILPARSSLTAKAATLFFSIARRAALGILRASWMWTGVQVNSNAYLSNAVVLRTNASHPK